jgi:hypothetical protein
MSHEFSHPAEATPREKLLSYAELILQSQKDSPIDPYSFIDENQIGFRKTDIDKDMREVERLRRLFTDQDNALPPDNRRRKQEGKKISEAIETIMAKGAERMD